MNGFGERDDDADDRRLSALLRAPQAGANPAVWARARTRLAAEAGAVANHPAGALDRIIDWLMRPAAMTAATAALVVSLGAGWSLVGSLGATTGATTDDTAIAGDTASLMESLLDPTATATSARDDDAPAAGESAAPGDSGGRS